MRTGRRCQSSPLSCPKGIGVRCTPQLVAPIDARVGGLHPRDERSRHLDLSRPHFPLGQPGLRFLAKGLRPRLRTLHIGTIRSTPVRGLRKCPWRFCRFLKASMVGFTLVARCYYYLRRRSPGPPFPPRPTTVLSYLLSSGRGTGGYTQIYRYAAREIPLEVELEQRTCARERERGRT
jgi:hypothetical protein